MKKWKKYHLYDNMEFENKIITSIKTKEIKVFEIWNIMQVRAGKYEEDQIFIIFSETTSSCGNGYGNIDMGTFSNLYIINISTLKFIKNVVKIR